MRVNRRFLYWGLVLVAIGGVLVASDLGAIDTATLADVLRLWPLAIVADRPEHRSQADRAEPGRPHARCAAPRPRPRVRVRDRAALRR